MSLRSLIIPLAVASLAGCNASPRSFSGAFSANSKGKASQMVDLAGKAGAEQHHAMELELSTTNEFDATVHPDGSAEFELRNIRMLSGNKELFNEAGPWHLKVTKGYPNGTQVFDSDTKLTDAQKWAVRCFLSYWRNRVPSKGIPGEVELDGLNYVRYSSEPSGTVSRTWTSHLDDTADLAEMPNRESIPLKQEVSGALTYRLASNGDVLGVSGEKSTTSRLGNRIAGNSSLGIKLEQRLVDPINRNPVYICQLWMVEPSKAFENEMALQTKTLNGAGLDELLEQANKKLTTKERNGIFLKLRALFYLNKEACTAAVDRIFLKPSVSPETRDLIAESLTGSGAFAAQSAFARLLKAEKGTEAFQSHLALLMPITRMEPSCQKMLLDTAFDINTESDLRYTAQLILGGNIRRCLTSSHDQGDAFTKRLTEALAAAKDEDTKLNLLYALGNAGNPNCLALQQQYLSDQSSTLRAGAVHSLRHLLSDSVRQSLVKLQKTDTDPLVQKEIQAVRTIGTP